MICSEADREKKIKSLSCRRLQVHLDRRIHLLCLLVLPFFDLFEDEDDQEGRRSLCYRDRRKDGRPNMMPMKGNVKDPSLRSASLCCIRTISLTATATSLPGAHPQPQPHQLLSSAYTSCNQEAAVPQTATPPPVVAPAQPVVSAAQGLFSLDFHTPSPSSPLLLNSPKKVKQTIMALFSLPLLLQCLVPSTHHPVQSHKPSNLNPPLLPPALELGCQCQFQVRVVSQLRNQACSILETFGRPVTPALLLVFGKVALYSP
jgi:hypothetical protein